MGDRSDVPHDGDRDDVLCSFLGIGVGLLSHLFSERKVDGEVSVVAKIMKKAAFASGMSNVVETFLVKAMKTCFFLENNIDKLQVIF